jgi:hypothetical protein
MTTTTPKAPGFAFRAPFLLAVGGAAAMIATGAFYLRAPSPASLTASAASANLPVTAPAKGPERATIPVSPLAVATPASPASGANETTGMIAPIQAAYRAGDFARVEREAHQTLASMTTTAPLTHRRAAAQVRKIQAFAAARRNNLSLARERFALLQQEAARLPDHGAVTAPGESPHATLEEDAAYQQAVCTVALGDKAAGEARYIAFIKTYPESPLVSGCIKRLMRLHGGNVPPEAEAAWRDAMRIAKERETERQRQASLCGPESLAYLLAGGKEPDASQVASLSAEMQTDEQGTRIGALESAARRHGFPEAQAAQMTADGLRQRLSQGPVIALIAPGHFVVVTEISERGVVRTWDANALGQDRPGEKVYLASEWEKLWDGYGVAPGVRNVGR